MPALAGRAGMPYARFLVFNAVVGIAWGATMVVLGYVAGASYATVEKSFGRDSALVFLSLVGLALLVWWVRRHRAARHTGD